MNILIVANHYAVCSARYATDAFQRLGHTVHHVGPAMGRNIWGLTLPSVYMWEPDNITLGEDEAFIQDASGVQSWIPDLIIVMDSDPAQLAFVRDTAISAVVWGVDNHVRDYRRDWFDHYFLAHRHASVMEWNAVEYATLIETIKGRPTATDSVTAHNPDMTWLPCAYDPVHFTPSPIPYEAREYDVCCLGVMYPQRREAVQKLRAAGLKVLAGTGLVYEAYRDAHHNSRLALCMSAHNDLAQRVFESAALGCLPLSDQTADLTHKDTNEALQALGVTGFPTFTGDDDMLLHAVSLTQGGEIDRAKMAIQHLATGQMRELNTWDARAEQIVRWYEQR